MYVRCICVFRVVAKYLQTHCSWNSFYALVSSVLRSVLGAYWIARSSGLCCGVAVSWSASWEMFSKAIRKNPWATWSSIFRRYLFIDQCVRFHCFKILNYECGAGLPVVSIQKITKQLTQSTCNSALVHALQFSLNLFITMLVVNKAIIRCTFLRYLLSAIMKLW